MVEATERKHVEKATINIESKVKGEFTYWKKMIWNSEQPLIMVMANYPISTDLKGDSLTSMLIRNAIVERNAFGGVIMANLFNKSVKWPSEKALLEASAPDGLEELVAIAKGADKVIIATGSLTTKYEVAAARLDDLIEQCKIAKMDKKLFWLVDSGGKKVHPLAIRNVPWQFGPVVGVGTNPSEVKEAETNE